MIAEDDLGLLHAPVRAAPMSGADRLAASFQEIQAFVAANGREPQAEAGSVAEMQLHFRLQAIRDNDAYREALIGLDEHGLLGEPEPPDNLADAIADDPLGLLNGGDDLHKLRHVPKEPAKPDEVARREPCPDFDRFEPFFKQCQQELREGKRRLIPFRNEQEIKGDTFYVLRGVLTYVAAEGERRREHGRVNARLRCIFENGTEANLLLRSLASQLYRFGKQVTDPEEKTAVEIEARLGGEVGYVYVLRTLSDDPQVSQIPDLHKIGFTTQSVAARTAATTQSTTFLGGPVEEVQAFEMPKAMARGVEGLLHRFFEAARLDIWFERDGIPTAEVTEWFSVPLNVIDEAVDLIEAESIQSYEYNVDQRRIVLRS
ncbi:MAG: GIY-YIG nuclease family protein [Solirubrobacterales bacterium]